jgi:hypothetical protein
LLPIQLQPIPNKKRIQPIKKAINAKKNRSKIFKGKKSASPNKTFLRIAYKHPATKMLAIRTQTTVIG